MVVGLFAFRMRAPTCTNLGGAPGDERTVAAHQGNCAPVLARKCVRRPHAARCYVWCRPPRTGTARSGPAQRSVFSGSGSGSACLRPWCGRARLQDATYARSTRDSCRSPRTSTWSRRARRTLPRKRSQTALARGARGSVRRSVMPLAATTRAHAGPHLPSLSRIRERGRWPQGGGRAQRLGDPGVGRLARRAQVDAAPRGQFDDEAGAQRPEEQVRDREDVARPAVGGVVAEEGGPRLPARARGAVAAPIGLAGALGRADAHLAELTAAALRAPERILGGHLADQGDGLRRQRRAARPRARLPSPARPEARAVPPQQRLRPDEEQGLPPGADPAREHHRERTIRRRHDRALDAPTQHEQLLAEHGVLGAQRRATPHHSGPGTGRMRQRQRPRPAGCAARAA